LLALVVQVAICKHGTVMIQHFPQLHLQAAAAEEWNFALAQMAARAAVGLVMVKAYKPLELETWVGTHQSKAMLVELETAVRKVHLAAAAALERLVLTLAQQPQAQVVSV
jgi:hypothetical protein